MTFIKSQKPLFQLELPLQTGQSEAESKSKILNTLVCFDILDVLRGLLQFTLSSVSSATQKVFSNMHVLENVQS
jgi:hypothetical protein